MGHMPVITAFSWLFCHLGWDLLWSIYVSNLNSVSPRVTKIVKATRKVENEVLGSSYGPLKVIRNSTIRWNPYEFLLASYIVYGEHKWPVCRYLTPFLICGEILVKLPHLYLAPPLGESVPVSSRLLARKKLHVYATTRR